MGTLSFPMILEGSKVLCVCIGISPGLLACSVVEVGPSPWVCAVEQCYSWPLVGVSMVLKECRLLSACSGISTVPLLLMVLEDCKILGVLMSLDLLCRSSL